MSYTCLLMGYALINYEFLFKYNLLLLFVCKTLPKTNKKEWSWIKIKVIPKRFGN